MRSKYKEQPVIVFFETKQMVTKLVKFCKANKLLAFSATDDMQLSQMMGAIRHQEKGVVATLKAYGRGADIRFEKDSFVVIGFTPKRMDEVKQMTGRSSRTMKTHMSKVIVVDPKGNPADVQKDLKDKN